MYKKQPVFEAFSTKARRFSVYQSQKFGRAISVYPFSEQCGRPPASVTSGGAFSVTPSAPKYSGATCGYDGYSKKTI